MVVVGVCWRSWGGMVVERRAGDEGFGGGEGGLMRRDGWDSGGCWGFGAREMVVFFVGWGWELLRAMVLGMLGRTRI